MEGQRERILTYIQTAIDRLEECVCVCVCDCLFFHERRERVSVEGRQTDKDRERERERERERGYPIPSYLDLQRSFAKTIVGSFLVLGF